MENGMDIEINGIVENGVDTEEGIGVEKDLDTEQDVARERDVNTERYADTEINIPRPNHYENRLTLVRISREIDPTKLDEMKEWFLEKCESVSRDDLSNVTSIIKLISLMEDKRIISMKECTDLKPILNKINPDLKEKLCRNCKYIFSCYSVKTYSLVEGSYKQFGHSRGMQLDFFSLFF